MAGAVPPLPRTERLAFDDLPDAVPAGQPLAVWLALAAAHPADRLQIDCHDGVRAQPPLPAQPVGDGRWHATLPPLGDGQRMSFTPTVQRSGLVIAQQPPRHLRGAAVTAPVPAVAPPQGGVDPAARRYEWASEFLGAFTVQLAKPPESFGPGPDGLHITFYIQSGEIRGPRLNAKIRGEGGDWMVVRRDGVGMANVRITYETDDGALLLSCYYGVFDLGPQGYERALRNDYDPVPPLVLAPQFNTSHPNWLWLNRLQCLAVGRVTMADLLVRFDLYAIRAGQPLPHSGLPRVDAPPLVGDIHR
jgi:hypothetical protein